MYVCVYMCIYIPQTTDRLTGPLYIASRQVSGSFAPRSVAQTVGPQTVGPHQTSIRTIQNESKSITNHRTSMKIKETVGTRL